MASINKRAITTTVDSRVIKMSIITISIMIKEVPTKAMGRMDTGLFHLHDLATVS
jgi:hypothetical protein